MRQVSSRAPRHGSGGRRRGPGWSTSVTVSSAVALASFLVLFGGLAAHTMLETGRDALFLARLSAHQLPWMYLALAAVAVLVTRARAGRLARVDRCRRSLAACARRNVPLLGGGLDGDPGLCARSTSGLDSSRRSCPMAFWLLLGEIYTIAQARRLYGAIGLGSQLGAIAAECSPRRWRAGSWTRTPARRLGRRPACHRARPGAAPCRRPLGRLATTPPCGNCARAPTHSRAATPISAAWPALVLLSTVASTLVRLRVQEHRRADRGRRRSSPRSSRPSTWRSTRSPSPRSSCSRAG